MYFKLFKKKLRERERDESYVSQSVLTLVIHERQIHTETFIRVNMLIIIALHKNKNKTLKS